MPEGDTIHTIAKVLGPDLIGQTLTLVEVGQSVLPWGSGAIATACEAIGKHLLITLGSGLSERTIRVHLGMKGSWHRYRPGEPWRRNPAGRRLVLQTPTWIFVCFGPKEVEVLTRASFKRPGVHHLGPDLLAADFDPAAALARARSRPTLAVADLLLTQTVAAGIGNVYKSEVLHIERLHPWQLVADLEDAALLAVYRRAAELMRENVQSGGWRITTTRATTSDNLARHWVYRRAKKPCFSCATLVRSRLQGPYARMTYWCPSCQPRPTNAATDVPH